MKIRWSPLAIERAGEIGDYIAQDNMHAADAWIEVLFEKVAILKANPELGRIVPEVGKPDIRELLMGNYRIIYSIDKKNVDVLTIRHFKQILPLEELKS